MSIRYIKVSNVRNQGFHLSPYLLHVNTMYTIYNHSDQLVVDLHVLGLEPPTTGSLVHVRSTALPSAILAHSLVAVVSCVGAGI